MPCDEKICQLALDFFDNNCFVGSGCYLERQCRIITELEALFYGGEKADPIKAVAALNKYSLNGKCIFRKENASNPIKYKQYRKHKPRGKTRRRQSPP